MRVRRISLLLLGATVLVAGTAGALLLRGHRDVTTSSEEAYRYYRLGLENEQKLYYKEAMAAWAEALRHDPHFVMAGIRLAAYVSERDPERAKSLVECVSRY